MEEIARYSGMLFAIAAGGFAFAFGVFAGIKAASATLGNIETTVTETRTIIDKRPS